MIKRATLAEINGDASRLGFNPDKPITEKMLSENPGWREYEFFCYTQNRYSLLHYFVLGGSQKNAKLVIGEWPESVNLPDLFGRTPYTLAVMLGNRDLAEFMETKGASITVSIEKLLRGRFPRYKEKSLEYLPVFRKFWLSRDVMGQFPQLLSLLVYGDSIDMVQELFEHTKEFDLSEKCRYLGCNFFELAVLNSNIDMFRLLIEIFSNLIYVPHVPEDSDPPIFIIPDDLVKHVSDVRFLEVLKELGTDIIDKDLCEDLLKDACKNGWVDIVKYLHENGADLTFESYNGHNLLWYTQLRHEERNPDLYFLLIEIEGFLIREVGLKEKW